MSSIPVNSSEKAAAGGGKGFEEESRGIAENGISHFEISF